MGFDETSYLAYLTEVVNRGTDVLPGIEERYVITGLRGVELAEQAARVRKTWPRLRRKTKLLVLVDRMAAAHVDLEAAFAQAARGDDSAIRVCIGKENEKSRERTTRFVTEITELAGGLGFVAAHAAERLGGGYGLNPAEVVAAVARLGGVVIAEPERLDPTPPVPRFRQYRQSIGALGHRHLPDFLVRSGACSGLSVLGRRITVETPAGAGIDAAAVQRSRDLWERRPRDAHQDHAVVIHGVCAQALGQGTDGLARLIRYEIIDALRERRRLGNTPGGLVAFAVTELRIREEEARRLVFAVLNEDATVGASAEYLRLRDLVDGDEIHAAAQYLRRQPMPEDAAELVDQINGRLADAEQRVARLAASSQTAGGDHEWNALAAIAAAVPDHPALVEHRARTRPAPADAVRAVADGAAVTVHWTASASTAGVIGYQVLRRRHRPPDHAHDTEIPVISTERTGVTDPAPPVNEPLYYAVVAQRDDVAAVLAVCGPVTVRVEPAEVSVEFGDGAVEGRWRADARMSSVRVRRCATGRDADQRWTEITGGRSGFLDRTVVNGQSYRYRITGVYTDAQGRESETTGAVFSGTPVRAPEPVRALSLEDRDGALLLSWDDSAGAHVRVYRCDLGKADRWTVGDRAVLGDLARHGAPVPGTARAGVLRVERPVRAATFVLVTVTGDTGIIGGAADYLPAADLGDVRAAGSGEEVVVSLAWPRDVAALAVEWDNAGRTTQLSATFARYQAENGLRLPVDRAHPTTVRVSPVVRHRSSEIVGTPTVLEVPRRVRASYRLETVGPPWRRELVVEVTADVAARIGCFTLGLRPGRVMPLELRQCDVLGDIRDEAVGPGIVARLTLPVPRRPKPYWLRGFLDGDAFELTDPPHNQLRKA